MPDNLLETELFGHERGAFTGAVEKAKGKFEQADGGTLFLDEIGNMSLTFQQKILRVLEYGTFTRVGGSKEHEVSTRVLAATNADLEEMMQRGEFLRDLYDRLAFEILALPPLRERGKDIEILASHFLDRFIREIPSFRVKRLSPNALEALRAYSFPGNVRELKNLIERAAFRDTTDELTADDLGLTAVGDGSPECASFRSKIEAYERHLISRALADSRGNQAEAARCLELEYHQLRYFLKKYGLPSSKTRRS